jgi:tetratricopeptide (TPR) repeat protein
MAHARRYEQITLADELRDRLAACEREIANIRGSGPGARLLLEDMDRISELWPMLEAAGLDLRPEAGRWETIQASMKRIARRLLKELRASGGLAAVRAQQHPDGQCAWWWRLDEAIAQDNKRRALRAGLSTATVVVAGLALYFIFRLLFPVDPNLAAAMDLQAAGEMKIQKSGDFTGALADFASATNFLPNDVETWLRLGVVQERLGDKTAMEESFKRARALVSSEADFEFARAGVYFALDMVDKAKADAEASVAAAPENPYGHYLLSSIYETLGQPQEALAALQRASDLAEAQQQTQLSAMARYRMAIMMQQVQQKGPETVVPTKRTLAP